MNPGEWVRDTRQYLNEVQGEYKKITWPSQQEAVAGTLSVVIVVTIVTTVLGIVDFALSNILGLVLQ
jgi:preprotein translocase subunit SecE